MALDDILISTGVDQLIRLLKERGRVEISEAARQLQQPMRVIEDWAHVLEDEGLIRIEYKLTKIYMIWHGPTKEYAERKKEEVSAEAGAEKQKIARLLESVEKGGQEISEMEQQLSKIKSSAMLSPEEIERLKNELAELEKKYNFSIQRAMSKMKALEKKLAALKPKFEKGEKADDGLLHSIAALEKFKSTVEEQMRDTDAFFDAFQGKLEDLAKKIEEGSELQKIGEIRGELDSIRSLRNEIAGAISEIAKGQEELDGRLELAEEKLSSLSKGEYSAAGIRKKFAEVRRMEEDAERQRKNIKKQLEETLLLIQKEYERLQKIASQQKQAEQKMASLKDEYVDIFEEVGKASEELAAKQKEISEKIALQMGALSAPASKISNQEILRVSSLISQLKEEQEKIEQKLLSLSKQAELLHFEANEAYSHASAPVQKVSIAIATGAEGSQEYPESFVEKINLTAEEAEDFERKREELRNLIRKMWEESKGGG
jgi:chromosome segregation ATPase